jgi:hypothetical protein
MAEELRHDEREAGRTDSIALERTALRPWQNPAVILTGAAAGAEGIWLNPGDGGTNQC